MAIGLRARTGRAVAVTIRSPGRSPVIVDRRWLELADRELPRQVYHAAARLALGEAQDSVRRTTAAAASGLLLADGEDLVRRARAATSALAHGALGSLLRELREAGHDVAGAGIVLAAGRPPTTLARALASHAALHAAEGGLYRSALAEAVAGHGLTLLGVAERDLLDRGARTLGIEMTELTGRLTGIGRGLGPPWGRDEKLAALVAWLALAAASSSGPRRKEPHE